MKTCAQCNRSYQNSLLFCPFDGSDLSASSVEVDASDSLLTADTLSALPGAAPETKDLSAPETIPTLRVAQPETSVWEISAVYSGGFHLASETKTSLEFIFWFRAFDSTVPIFSSKVGAKAVLISSAATTEGLRWNETTSEVAIEEARPILQGLKDLGFPNGTLQGGGVGEGSEMWDKLTVVICLEAQDQVRQCVLGGYDWKAKLPLELRLLLARLLAFADGETWFRSLLSG